MNESMETGKPPEVNPWVHSFGALCFRHGGLVLAGVFRLALLGAVAGILGIWPDSREFRPIPGNGAPFPFFCRSFPFFWPPFLGIQSAFPFFWPPFPGFQSAFPGIRAGRMGIWPDSRDSALEAWESTLEERESALEAWESTLEERESALEAWESALEAWESALEERESAPEKRGTVMPCFISVFVGLLFFAEL